MEQRDERLWKIAKKRAGFKKHLATYIVINGFFWAIWYFTSDGQEGKEWGHNFPWPVWPMIGWGIGLIFDYLGAYHFNKDDLAEKEYERLLNNRK